MGEDIEVEPKLVASVLWLPVPPFPQTAAVLGHHQHDAVTADAKVMYPADPWHLAQLLHDGNLLESRHLHSTT